MIRYFRPLLLWLALVLLGSSPVAAQQWTITSGAISTAGATCSTSTNCLVAVDLRNVPSFGVYLDVATSGTFNFEATIDGTNWFSVNDDVNAAATATTDGAYFFTNPGYRQFRVRASAISGTATLVVHRGVTGLRSTATLSGSSQGDGAIQDGANSAIEATVFDLTNANPLTVGIVDASGNQITSFGGGTQYTNGSAQATPTGTVALGFDGANVRGLATDASGNLSTNLFLGGSAAGTGSGTNGATVIRVNEATDSGLATDTAAIRTAVESSATSLDNIEGNLSADAVHDNAAIATGPQGMLEAASDMSANTAVADGDTVRQIGDLLGRSIVAGPCDRAARVGGVTTVTDGSATSAIAAGGAGVFLEVWDVVIANTSATAVTVDIRDGVAGSVLATFPVPADTAGVVHRFSVPLTSSANTAIAVDPSAAASSIVTTLRGCKVK